MPSIPVLATALATLTFAAAPLLETDYERSGVGGRDLGKGAKSVAEYFEALDADQRADMREARDDLLASLEKALKKAKADGHPLSYSGDLEILFEMSKPENRDIKSKYGKGFFQHTFVDPYSNEGTGVLLSVPKSYSKATEEFLPAIVVLKDPVGGDKVADTLAERAEAVYADLMESHIILFPLGNMQGEGRRAELSEQDESWLTEKGLRVLFTSLRVLSEQVRHDRSRIVLDGWGASGEDALRVASVAPGLFAGVVNRGGGLGDDSLVTKNLDNSPMAYVVTDDAAADADAAEGLLDDVLVVADAGALHAPSGDVTGALAEWITARSRPLAPKTVDYKLNDLRFQSANWVKALKINRRSTARPGDKDFPSIHAEVKGNTIDIDTVNVEQLYLFLSDDLVDLDSPVTINVNGDERVNDTFDRSLDFVLENRFFNNSGDFGVYTTSVEINDIDPNVPE